MYLLYSIILSLGVLLMSPLFLLRREKYASGFSERLGNYPEFKHDGRPAIWLHCVSVGETNAARPLVDAIRRALPENRLVISTTTKTGQELAQKIFTDKADAIVYFPFDWKFSVRRALRSYKPSLVLLMETEIWPRFIHEAKRSGAKVAIVNGRLSQRSFDRYSIVRSFVVRVLADVDFALMQNGADAERIKRMGIQSEKVAVVGNLKFEQPADASGSKLTEEFRSRFGISTEKPLIIAASTHEPEERYVIESLEGELGYSCRLMIAPRHPERFDIVAKLVRDSPYKFVRRSDPESDDDADADVILLDSIGELREAYPLAEIVFVGGSLIPHGGQSIIEPAAEGKAIVTGPYTANFDAVVKEFREHDAVRQTPVSNRDFEITERLHEAFMEFLENPDRRIEVGRNAISLMRRSDREATKATIAQIHDLLSADRETHN
ncbi:MAG: 3-deoxy-D-manno-octulosonic acid transferase [Pyrinomonadaceae bacterium]